MMEYLHRKLQDLILDFNYHGKCEKLHIIDVSFADDLLLFTRGNIVSIQLVMDMIHAFSKSIRLYVNPSKCKVYFGGMKDNRK